ncbi:MAG: glutamate-cysteine ligase family protein, partial [Thermoanaerobaculia bacterium]|nr:glutamate-cysteine ligase family protein [Thermoanaerobaculia bacterium]
MGDHDRVREKLDPAELRLFTKALLVDLRALETMLEEGRIESDRRRLGAEQEVVLVDDEWRPAPVNLKVLERLADERFTTELGRFNIEFNLDPVAVGEHSLAEMERQLRELLTAAQAAAAAEGARIVLTGILPTLNKSDLTLDGMTPHPRYYALNEAMNRVRGRHFSLRIKGRDELIIEHDNVMLEACNTSFQLHYQVSAEEFARSYNIAQLVAAPVLACATNSPLLFGRQLWRETRIALFQQSVDTRGRTDAVRESIPRVSFGRQWVRESALEIFQEDLARFQVLLGGRVDQDPFEVLAAGGAPDLTALRIFNSTVYRWNRPCYGISDGKPHLRIENRILPSGPTTRDELANAAFWFGLMRGMPDHVDEVQPRLDFGVVRENFVAAARLGLGANLAWLDGRRWPAGELVLEVLLPIARQGLAALGIGEADAHRYLDVVEERTAGGHSGAQWLIDSIDAMDQGSRYERLAALTAAIAERQGRDEPVHTWAPAELTEAGDWSR